MKTRRLGGKEVTNVCLQWQEPARKCEGKNDARPSVYTLSLQRNHAPDWGLLTRLTKLLHASIVLSPARSAVSQ